MLCFAVFAVFVPRGLAQVPVFEIAPVQSWIKFHVKSSTTIAGKFDKWEASLTFKSPDETTGALELKIEAASVDTGSGMKNGKLKSKDFFDVDQNPYIIFRSTKFVPTGPHTYEVDGDFTIRGVSNPEKLTLTVSGKGSGGIHGAMVFNRKDYGVSNPEKLTLTVSGKGTGSGETHGAMVFNRKDYGMNKGIPFIKIADHVDVDFHLKWKHVSGPPLA